MVMRGTFVLFVALSVSVGCSSDGATAVAPSPRGSWSLSTVAGAALPFVASSGGDFGLVELTGQKLVINDNTFTLVESYRQTVNGTTVTMADSLVGWAVVNAQTAHLTTSDGVDAMAELQGGRLLVNGGLPFVYERQ